MNGKKCGACNACSLSITNATSSTKELSGSLLPGSGVNMAIVQHKSVKRGMANPEGPKNNSSMGADPIEAPLRRLESEGRMIEHSVKVRKYSIVPTSVRRTEVIYNSKWGEKLARHVARACSSGNILLERGQIVTSREYETRKKKVLNHVF